MSVVETLLIFVCIPALVFGVLAALTVGRGSGGANRYRPGQSWDHEPVWFVGHPGPGEQPAEFNHTPALTAGSSDGASAGPVRTAEGGSRGSW